MTGEGSICHFETVPGMKRLANCEEISHDV